MKNFLLCLTVLTCGMIFNLSAQELAVRNFELRSTDLTAKIANKKDLNGDVCAMVKIFVALPKISIPENMINGEVEKAAYSEFRVFMPAGSRRIQINAPGFLPLEYRFPEPLETMRTYELRLWRSGDDSIISGTAGREQYKVGDSYNVDTNAGIVFEVGPTGREGKIVALFDADSRLVWEDALAEATRVGNGWRLPTREEMLKIFGMRKDLAKWFKSQGGNMLKEESYWTGTNVDASKMFPYDMDMHAGKDGKIHKKNPRLVRLVYDFKVELE